MKIKLGSRGVSVRLLQKALNRRLHLGLSEDGIYGKLTEEAVKQAQTLAGIEPDGIAGLSTLIFLAGETARNYIKETQIKHSARKITEIIIHCTATPEGREYSVETIRAFHKASGWSDIGYHYIIHLDGKIGIGRDVDKMGAHTANHNAYSIGVAYVGGCETDARTPKDTRTLQQKEVLRALLTLLTAEYPGVKICGHRDKIKEDEKKGLKVTHKACPCYDAEKEYADLC